jgi:molybdopterin molybdotransferase
MITVDEALQLICNRARRKASRAIPLREALGRVLAEDVVCDRDSPPWDKAMVDGYAVRSDDLASGTARLSIAEEVMAGAVPVHALHRGQATRVMTGAPIPQGCDAVVMVEKTTAIPSPAGLGHVEIVDRVSPGQNILRQASAMRCGDTIFKDGITIRPVEIGVLAEVGRSWIKVTLPPRMAVLSTGNELVPCDQLPGPGQIRNSNGPMLLAAGKELGVETVDLGIARDEPDMLRDSIARGLECDILVLSGGVSAGVLDLVPQILRELGVQEVFHKVRLKPGKPLWFGTRQHRDATCLVFGLPGNPVSSHVCFHLFVRPAIAAVGGHPDVLPLTIMRLASEFAHRGDRPTYHPGRITDHLGQLVAAVRWQGSADLYGLSQANALIRFPPGDHLFRPGDAVEVFVL